MLGIRARADGEADVALTIKAKVKKSTEPGLKFELSTGVTAGCPKTERTASIDEDKRTGQQRLVFYND